MKKKSSWIKRRHAIVRNLVYLVIAPYAKWKYGVTVEKCEALNNRQCLILINHQTAFDQFFVGMAFSGPVYYLATEDIFSNGWISSLIRWLVAPISIKKQTVDLGAVKNCIRVAKEGGTIALAPEGNRTYSGKTEHINPAIASLARKLRLPIALYRIEGGYGVQPRWSDVIRKGKMRAYVSKIIEPEEFAALSNDELNAVIIDGLYVEEPLLGGTFDHKRRAEYLERAAYVCPYCGLSSFYSRNETLECTKCHRQIEYGRTLALSGVGFAFPFRFFTEWYDYQKTFINALDITMYTNEPAYRETVTVFEVIVNKRKQKLYDDAQIALFGDRIDINGTVLRFDDCRAVAVLGRNKLNIYHEEKVYQFKGNKRFNALKYVNFYYRYKNRNKEGLDGKFLGL